MTPTARVHDLILYRRYFDLVAAGRKRIEVRVRYPHLEDLAAGRSVARLRYGQVFGEACRTAERIGRALQARGWTGTVRRCGPCCTVEPG